MEEVMSHVGPVAIIAEVRQLLAKEIVDRILVKLGPALDGILVDQKLEEDWLKHRAQNSFDWIKESIGKTTDEKIVEDLVMFMRSAIKDAEAFGK
jgi:hypothetical protein